MTQQDWELYFCGLASRHKSVGHTSEKRHFFRGEVNEFFDGFRSKLNYPAVVMESSLLDVRGDMQMRQVRTLAFIVVKGHQRDDWNEVSAALSECETIGLQMLGRLREDIAGETVPELSVVRLEDIHGEPMAKPEMKYVGWRFEFTVSEPICIHDKNVWHEED